MAVVQRDWRIDHLDKRALSPAEVDLLGQVLELAVSNRAFARQLARQVGRVASLSRDFHQRASRELGSVPAKLTSALEHFTLWSEYQRLKELGGQPDEEIYVALGQQHNLDAETMKKRIRAAKAALSAYSAVRPTPKR